MFPHSRSSRTQLLLVEELQDVECPRLEVALTMTLIASSSSAQVTMAWLETQSREWFWIIGAQGAVEEVVTHYTCEIQLIEIKSLIDI